MAARKPTLITPLQIAHAQPTLQHVSTPAGHRSKMPLAKWRKPNNLNHIYQFDTTSLGQRTPVILVPGRAEEFQRSSWWQRLYNLSQRKTAFKDRYKLYVFIYNSKDDVSETAGEFNQELQTYFKDLPSQDRHLKIICYSLGGTIIQKALSNPTALEMVDSIQALAVAFHGSPMFNPEWFEQYLRPLNHSPIRQWWDRACYKLYLFDKNNLTKSLAWDNFDGSQPLYGDVQIQGHQIVSPYQGYSEEKSLPAFKQKLTIYASYLENPYTQADSPHILIRAVDLSISLPKVIIGSVLPFYGLSVHSVFKYMNQQLATLPTYSAEEPRGETQHLYRYNDGAFPLSSMLYLPPRGVEYNERLEQLTQFIDVKKARIFKAIDHMDMGEYAHRRNTLKTNDLMEPGLSARSPSQWLLDDLLNSP